MISSAPTRHVLLATMASAMLLGASVSASERKLQDLLIFSDETPAVGTTLSELDCGIVYEDVDFAGNDLGTSFPSGGDPSVCHIGCQRTAGCDAWTETATASFCFLKDSIPQQVLVEATGDVTSFLCEEEVYGIAEDTECGLWQAGRDFVGNDVGDVKFATADDEECETFCTDEVSGCNSATRRQDDGTCFGKTISPSPNAVLVTDERFNTIRICED